MINKDIRTSNPTSPNYDSSLGKGLACKRTEKQGKRNFAFTLAETLITLVIVGVVAALTVPNLIVKHQKEETVTKLKTVYSTLSNASNIAIMDNGPIKNWDIDTTRQFKLASAVKFFDTYMKPYLKFSTICYQSWRPNKCTKVDRPTLANTTKIYTNTSNNPLVVEAVLLDGTFMMLYTYGGVASVLFDINGDKKPNRYGKDTFTFVYDKSANKCGFLGAGSTRQRLLNHGEEGCNKTAVNRAGVFCGALIQQDHWKISDDYPW